MRTRILNGRLGRLVLVAGSVATLTLGSVGQPAFASSQTVDPATCAQLARLGVTLPLVIVPGDVDRNGVVDIFDYNAVVTDYGKTGPNLLGDINKDGRVDQIDYQIVLATFGFRSPCR